MTDRPLRNSKDWNSGKRPSDSHSPSGDFDAYARAELAYRRGAHHGVDVVRELLEKNPRCDPALIIRTVAEVLREYRMDFWNHGHTKKDRGHGADYTQRVSGEVTKRLKRKAPR